MSLAYVLNPPRRKARLSNRKSRRPRRNVQGWFGHKPKGAHRVAYSHPTRKKNARRHRRSRRHLNPGGALYALNRGRRHRRSRRHLNPGGALYALNRGRRHRRRGHRRNPGLAGGLIQSVPQVVGFRVPLGGLLGKITNSIVQGTAAGTVVFGGFVLSAYIINPISDRMKKADGSPMLGRLQKPVLYGAAAGLVGGLMSFGAKLFKGNRHLWFILGAAGPGLHALGNIVKEFFPAPSSGLLGKVKDLATGLADYIQVGDQAYEAGVGDGGDDGGDSGSVDDFINADGNEASIGENDYTVAEDAA